MTTPTVTLPDLNRLPAVVRVWSPDPADPTLASIVGLSKSAAYEAINRGEFPALHVGRRVLVPVPALLALLGVGVGNGQHDPEPREGVDR